MSVYLGRIGGNVNGRSKMFEIHALTNGLPFDGYPASEMSDSALYKQMLEGRYKILESGKPIYCTAVNPDKEKKIETNPHDERPGTVHIVTISEKGNVIGGLSVATDIGDTYNGDRVGLPLENMFKPGSYPVGASLDDFRKKYIRLNYGRDRDIKPGEMAELYRHFKLKADNGDLPARLGLYAGTYNLTVRETRKRGQTPTWIWVFDAIPAYFNLYKWAGAAVLRDPTVQENPQWISPNKGQLKLVRRGNGDGKGIFYKDKDISRSVPILRPSGKGANIKFKLENVSFLDGVVDILRDERAVIDHPLSISPLHYEGMNMKDMINLRTGLSVMGARVFEDTHNGGPVNFINRLARKHIESEKLDFNGVGKKPDGMSLEQMYSYDI